MSDDINTQSDGNDHCFKWSWRRCGGCGGGWGRRWQWRSWIMMMIAIMVVMMIRQEMITAATAIEKAEAIVIAMIMWSGQPTLIKNEWLLLLLIPAVADVHYLLLDCSFSCCLVGRTMDNTIAMTSTMAILPASAVSISTKIGEDKSMEQKESLC